MNTVCIGCGQLVKAGRGGRCSRCVSTMRRYRSSYAWQQKRAAARRGQVCHRCGSAGPLDVHHSDGIAGPLVPLCGPCHDAEHGKTKRSVR